MYVFDFDVDSVQHPLLLRRHRQDELRLDLPSAASQALVQQVSPQPRLLPSAPQFQPLPLVHPQRQHTSSAPPTHLP